MRVTGLFEFRSGYREVNLSDGVGRHASDLGIRVDQGIGQIRKSGFCFFFEPDQRDGCHGSEVWDVIGGLKAVSQRGDADGWSGFELSKSVRGGLIHGRVFQFGNKLSNRSVGVWPKVFAPAQHENGAAAVRVRGVANCREQRRNPVGIPCKRAL